MSPERKTIIDDTEVEEYYWAGRMVVYIDNRLTNETYEAACKRLNLEAGEMALSEADMPGGFN